MDQAEQRRQTKQEEEGKTQNGSDLATKHKHVRLTAGGITVKTSTTKSKTGFGSAIGEFMPLFDAKQGYPEEEDEIPVE